MSLSAILAWMLCGLIVGVIARFLISAREDASLLMTVGLGIIGAAVGGLLYAWFTETPRAPWSFSGTAWHSWLAAGLAAALVLGAFEYVKRKEA